MVPYGGGGIMQALKLLEEKIASLIELIKELKNENAKLAEENAQLEVKVKSLEDSLKDDVKQSDKLTEEKELTRLAVDDLIKSIDSLVELENQ